ncbi:MAG: S1 RNA-binding domain-containing protein [Oscillibacter sp.]|nr:S1 RNA-binding domain-containing protein [Oscillibacter sp.]
MEPQAGTIEVGAIMEGKVTSITNFGAFVDLGNRRSGLVHISEIANTFVNNVRDFLEEGQSVKVLVLSADNGKINLSIKKAQPRPAPPRPGGGEKPRPAAPRPASGRTYARAQGETLPPSGDQAFEDKLKRFLSSSEGKMADLNRSAEGKRGGGRRRR